MPTPGFEPIFLEQPDRQHGYLAARIAKTTGRSIQSDMISGKFSYIRFKFLKSAFSHGSGQSTELTQNSLAVNSA
jgi:hypothetical protein